MDLELTATALREAEAHYQACRAALHAVRHEAARERITGVLASDCLRLVPDAPLRAPISVAEALLRATREARAQLHDARLDFWEAQGKMLRYTVVVVRNRAARYRDAAAEGWYAQAAELADSLMQQAEAVEEALTDWASRRRPVRQRCSPAALERILADPDHAADKEHLERILARAQAAHLPRDQDCIALQWDAVTGVVQRAAVEGPGERTDEGLGDQERAA